MSKKSSQPKTFDPADLPDVYSVLFAAIQDAVWIVDRDYRIAAINDSMLHKINRTREQVIGRYCYEVNARVDKPCGQRADCPCPVMEVWQKGTKNQTLHTYFSDDGELFYIELTAAPLKDQQGRIVGVIETHHDISAEKQLERQLAAIYKLGQELTLMQDETAVIERVLETAVKYLKYRSATCGLVDAAAKKLAYPYYFKEKLIPLQDLSYPLSGNSHQAINVVNNGQPTYVAYEEYDGIDYQPVNPVICMPMIAQGRVIGVLSTENNQPAAFTGSDLRLLQVLADQAAIAIANARLHKNLKKQIALLKETQAQIIQNGKLAAVGELVAGVAHELNNPLTTIVLYSQLLQHKLTDLALQENLDIIVAEAKRAGNVVQSLLDFSRQRPMKREKLQINDVIEKTLALMSYTMRTHNIHWETHLTADLPETTADSYQMQQVFVNIINNALQAMSQEDIDRRLIISSACTLPQFPGPRAAKERIIRVTIANNGPHISKKILPRVFDPFFTTKAPGQGTGLGLSVCHGIISEHGGRIWIESEPGEETAVHIELPLITAEPQRQQTGPLIDLPPEDTSNFSRRILILDDEESLRQILTEAIKREGYQVDALADADAALSRLNEQDYDLIICDIRMPGMSGIEFYRQIEASRPHLTRRFMFTTGDVINQDTTNFLAETGAPCLTKPFELPALAKRVRQELRRMAQLSV